MKKQNIYYSLFLVGFIFLIFRNWFLVPKIIGGDWPYLFDENLRNYSLYFSAWNSFVSNGLGGTNPSYALSIFNGITVFLSQAFHFSWPFIYKISWFGLFIGLSIFSSMCLLKTVLPRVKFWQLILSAIIFSTNTYILMVVSGGQMGVALAYSVAPFILARFIKVIHDLSFYSALSLGFREVMYHSALAGLVLAVQVMFDPRIAYVTMIGVVLYFILNITKNMTKNLYLVLFVLIIPIILSILLHASWILPILISKQTYFSDLGGAFVSAGIVKFLSFTFFSQSFSLLHPNWPENIFGKVYFMKNEFILIPILAFSSLLFLANPTVKKFNKTILFLCFLGLLGSFLAKGTNPPFEGIYLWLFGNIPGFVILRDSTKFYTLIALSYSMLIPFSIYYISEWLNSKLKNQSSKFQFKIQNYLLIVFFIFFIGYWMFLIRPAILGQLGGTFKRHEVPKEYIGLKDLLYNQKEYFRTLWVPRQQRFSFISDIHPAIEAEPLLGTRNVSELSKKISSKQTQSLLSELSIKYIVIPYDSLGEQFLDDRKYSEKLRIEYEKKLDTIPWLKKIKSGKIAIYETPANKDHFFLDKGDKISSVMISPTHYILTISVNEPQNLIFSENFNPYWVLAGSQKIIYSQKTKNGLNSFWLDQKGKYTVDISFSLEKYYKYGQIISLIALVVLTIFLIKLRKKMT